MFVKDTPPSVERASCTPSAYTLSEFTGSTAMSPKYQPNPPKMPVKPLASRRAQVVPPSVLRYMPSPL